MSKLDVALEQARQACLQNDYQKAYRVYEELLKEFPNNLRALLDYGRAKYREFADLEQAAALFLQAVKIDPNCIEALLWLGDVSFMGYGPDYREAVNIYHHVLELEPQCADAYIGLGMLYKSPGSPVTLDEAIGAYRKAIEIAPERVDAHQNLGYVLLDAHQEIEAEEELSIAARLLHAEGRNFAGIQKNIERLRSHEPIVNRAYFNDSERFRWLSK